MATKKKEPSYMILRRAFALYVKRDHITYWYGAKGQLLTEKTLDALIAAEPAHFSRYSESELKRLKNEALGKIGYDCSGFVGACVGKMEWSGALWNDCVNKTTIAEGKAGSILYKKGHVAIDIGYGYEMEIPTEGRSLEIWKNSERGFTGSGEFKTFDYSEANAN
jgi:hypothetical protein